MPDSLPKPLGGPPPREINLPRAPLVLVVAQTRFPGILKIDNKEAVAPFQESIRRDYPLFTQEATQQIEVQIGPGGPMVRPVPGTIWRFRDAEQFWRLSLSNNALSLETERYPSRKEFLTRWTKALAAVQDVFDPQFAVRIGMRYIDRVVGKPYENIDGLVRPDILGIAQPPLRQHMRSTLTEATLRVSEGEMLLRWGIMPANGTIDPTVLKPIAELSWILDIDVFSGEQRPFSKETLGTAFQALAERAYAVFRYTITKRFLETYGSAQ
jgi:uncharacterized protein (TIGR04255 family)